MNAVAAPGLWAVPGQEQAVAVLRGAVERDEVGHAWAFVGPAGLGQQQAARALAAALNCLSPPGPGLACGACSTCDRIARGAHVAYTEFVPTGAFHRVDEVRERWLAAAGRTLVEGRWKVLRVCDADRMNEASANAFLKGLEEPPERTVWVLDIADPDELPETILSRCRVLRFAAWGPDELDAAARRLEINEPRERALAVRAALGAPAVLERLAAPGGLDDLRTHREIPRRIREEGQGHALVAAFQIAGRAKAKSDPKSEVERRTEAVRAQGEAELAALLEQYGDEPRERALAVRAALGAPAVLERLAAPGGLDDLRNHRAIPRHIREEGQGHALVAAFQIAGRAKAKSDRKSEVERRTEAVRAQGEAELAALLEQYGDEPPRAIAKELEERNARREREARTQAVVAALDDLLSWLRDCVLVAAGGDPEAAIHADDPAGLRADAEALGLDGLMTAIDRVFTTRETLERNVQPLLALEALFMELAALMLRRRP